MSQNGFIKLIRGTEAEELLAQSPGAFALLSLVALRARRTSSGFHRDGLEPGQAKLGDPSAAGLTRGQYRNHLNNLQKWGFVTIKTTNKGTIVTLCDSRIYDINSDGLQPAEQPTNNHQTSQQHNHPTTTNKNVRREKNGRREEKAPPYPHGGDECASDDADLFSDAVKPTKPRRVGPSRTELDAIYQAYPRKVAPAKAKAAIAKALQIVPYTDLLDAVTAYRDAISRWPADRRDFIPHPATWFNGRRWEDDRSEWEHREQVHVNGSHRPTQPETMWSLSKRRDTLRERLEQLKGRSPGPHFPLTSILTTEELAEYNDLRAQDRDLSSRILKFSTPQNL